MTTEAEIIPEPISMVKTEEERKHLTLEPCDKPLEFLTGDLKNFQAGFIQPAETDECLAKVENMEVASNKGVETVNTVSKGNPAISKGESFLMSPEISIVANETCGMSEHTQVDCTPFKAGKIAQDEEKMAIDEKIQLEGEAGTAENEVKDATEDRMEKSDPDHGIEELGKQASIDTPDPLVDSPKNPTEDRMEKDSDHSTQELEKQASIHTPDPIVDSLEEANETVTEASNSNLIKEVKDSELEKLPAPVDKEEVSEAIELTVTSGSEKAQIISHSIGKALTLMVAESEEVTWMNEPAPEVDEKLGKVSGIIIKDKNQAAIESSEEIKCITGENDGRQYKNLLDTSSVTKTEEPCSQEADNRGTCNLASDIRTESTVEESPTEEIGQSEINEKTHQDSGTSSELCKDYAVSESEKVAMDVKVVQAASEELAITEESDEMKRDAESAVPMPEGNINEVEHIPILKESFQQKSEPEKEKAVCPLNVVSQHVNTAVSGETAETSTSIKEATSVKDHEERFEAEGMEDTPTNTDAISGNGESKEKDHLEIEVNENTEAVEVEISDENADDLHVTDSLVGQPAEYEHKKQHDFSSVQPEEQVHEAIGASKEKEVYSEDVSEACQNIDSMNPEHIFTEAAATTDSKSETSKMDKENVKEAYLFDSKSERNEASKYKEEGTQQELEDCTAEKPEPKDFMENIEDNLKQEETKEVSANIDGSKRSTEEDEKEETPEVEVCGKLEPDKTVENARTQILEEEDTTKDQITVLPEMMKEKSKEENAAAMMSIKEVSLLYDSLMKFDNIETQKTEDDSKAENKFEVSTSAADQEGSFGKEKEEREPEIEMHKESETAASGTAKEDPHMEEQPKVDIFNSSIGDETVKESIKEGESSPMKLTEEASNSNIEETDPIEETIKPNNDPTLFAILKDPKEEITPVEVKEGRVCSSSFEYKESKQDTEEETSIKGSVNTADLDSASCAAETEDTITKEAKTEKEKNETSNVLDVEENSLATTEHEEIGVYSAEVDVKSVDSNIKSEKDMEIPQEEDGMQDKHPNAGSEDQLEMTTKEIPLKEISEDEVKEQSTMPPEEYEATLIEERKITDETSEKDEAPYEHTETPVSQATDEKLMQNEVNATLDVLKAEPADTGNESGHEVVEQLAEQPNVHTEQESGICSPVSEVTNVSTGDEPRELENQTDAREAKTQQDEKSSDLGQGRERIEEGKPLDQATELGESLGTCKDGEKAIEEENLAKNLAKPESLEEYTEIGKDTELATGAHDQILESVIMNDNAKNVQLAAAGLEEKPKSHSVPVIEDQSKETFPEPSKSEDDETSSDAQNQETEEQGKEELKIKLEDEDYFNREENVNEVNEAVIWSEKVDEEVEKADDSEDIKEHFTEEESSTNELNAVSKGDEINNEVEDYILVTNECLKEEDSKEQIKAEDSEVEEHSTDDREASLVIKESEERRQDGESGDPVNARSEDREAEEKTEEIIGDSKHCQAKSHIEAVTEERAERSLNNTEVKEELVDTPNISSVKMSLENIESDANQETKVENVQLEEISSELAPHIQTNENDELQKQNLNMDIGEKDEADIIKRDPDAFYIPKDQIAEAEKCLTVEKMDQLNSDHELVKSKKEAFKTSNADDVGKIELASDGDHVSEDKGTERDAETKKCLTAEMEISEVEETNGIPGTTSDYISQKVDTIFKDDIRSPNNLPQEKLEEQLQTSASTLLSEDEEIRAANLIEKIDADIQKETEIKHESLEDSSDKKTVEEVCLPNEEQRKHKAVSEEEIIADQGLPNDEKEEQIQTTSSTLPSEEREHEIGDINEDNGKEKEVPTKRDAVTGDEITSEQAILANKPEEGTASTPLVPKEKEEENTNMVEQTEEKINQADIPDKISEDSSDGKKTAEIYSDDAKKDETAAAQAPQVEEPNEQSLTLELPAENIEHGATANEAKKVEKLEKEMCSEKEGELQGPEAVVDQETITAQALITDESMETETIGTVEKLDEEKSKEAEKLEDENYVDSAPGETKETCFQEEEPNELHSVPKEEITSGQTFSAEQLHISTFAITSEELEQEIKETKDKKTNKGGIIKDEIEDASDAKTTVEICSQKERSIELEAVVEDETNAGQTLAEKKLGEQVQNQTFALPSECEISRTAETIESEKTDEAEFLPGDNEEDASFQKEWLQEDEALAVDDNASPQTIPTVKPEEPIPNPVVTLPAEEHKHETINEVDKTEEEKVKEEQITKGDSGRGKTVEEISSEKEETREPQAELEGESEESQEHRTVTEEKKIKEAETFEDEKSPQSEHLRELQGTLEDRATAAHTLPGEMPTDHLHITTSTLPSEVEGEEMMMESELQEDESPEKIPEQTRESEKALYLNMETDEKTSGNELLTETEDSAIKKTLVKGQDETGGEENQCEKTNEGNEIILYEVSKEEVMKGKEVTETSYSTSHLEELIKDGSEEDKLKDKLIEDKTYEELIVEAQKTSENKTTEKQVKDKTIEDPGQVSGYRIETTKITEEESSIELSAAEGNRIIDDIQKPEETTNIASDEQIPRKVDPIEKIGITSSITKEHVTIDLQEGVAQSLAKPEVVDVTEICHVVEHGGEKTVDNSGEEITEESTLIEDSSKISSSDHVESPRKETLQVTQAMFEENEAKDEINASQNLLAEKPQEQSPAPSSKLPSEERKHGVTTQVDAVEEKELKEMETPNIDSPDTKTEGEICLEEEEKKELKAVVEQEIIAAQVPTEIKEQPVFHLEDGSKEEELKDEYIGDKTNETLKIPAKEIQSEKLSVEIVKDGANNNIEKEIITEDESVKKELQQEEKEKKEINNVLAVEEKGLATTEHGGTGVECTDIYVKSVNSSITSEKDMGVPQEENGMQDKFPNAGSGDQLEMTTKEIPSKEILGDEVKEHSTMPSEEYEATLIEKWKITDETLEKDKAIYEYTETPLSRATDEKLMPNEDNPTLDVLKAEAEDTGKKSGHEVEEQLAKEPNVHTEQESGKCSSVSEVTNVYNGEEPREMDNQTDASDAKTLQDEQSSDLGLEGGKIEDRKPSDEATDFGETLGTCKDGKKAIEEEENLAKYLAKAESLKDGTEIGKDDTELARGDHYQIPEAVNVKNNAKKHGSRKEEKEIKETETMEDEKSQQSERARELRGASEDGAAAAHTLPSEKPRDHLHIIASTWPSDVQGDEMKETELQEDESPKKIPEQTGQIEGVSNFNKETLDKAFDDELLAETEDAAIKENIVKARDESGDEEKQYETNKGNEIILKEAEEVTEGKDITETSYSTSLSEELTKDGSGEDELKDKLSEDKTYEKPVVETQKTSENEIIEKKIEDETVEDPGKASFDRIETTTVAEEESSTELSAAEGNQTIDDIRQPEETINIASDKQIPRELDPIGNIGITSSIAKEPDPIDLQDRVAESSQKAEVGIVKEIYPDVVEHGGEKTADNSGEEITEESISIEDLSKISSSHHVEISTKETLQVTQDMIEEREAKDETNASQILLVEKPEEQSPDPSSKLPSEEREHGVTTQVEEKEVKEVETLDKDSSDTKTGGEICLEEEENKELKAVMEQQTIAVQAPQTEIKEEPVFHFEDGSKEDELKDEHIGDETNETLKIPAYEIQNEKFSVETLKDDTTSNIKREIASEDETVKELEQAEEEKKEINDVHAVVKEGPATTEHEGTGVDSADIDVKSLDSSRTCKKDRKVPQEEDGMQDKMPNAGGGDQLETTTKEIPLKEIIGDEVKEHSTMPSEEYEATVNEGRKITDENSEKDQTPYEHSETPMLQATEEILMQNDDNPKLDVPKLEPEDIGKESGHEVKEHLAEKPNVHIEQESGKCSSVSEVTNVSNVEEPRELDNQTEACETKTLQDEQSSDLGLERVKIEDGKPLDEATDFGETSGTCKDGEKAIKEDSLAKYWAEPESLTEDTEIGKEDTELARRANDQIPEMVNVNDNAKLIIEAQKTSENEITEKQIDDRTLEDPGQASVAQIETTTVTEESSTELSTAEGNQIIDDIQQPKETINIASDEQIPRDLDPIENTRITILIAREQVPIDLQEKVAESSQKAEVGDVTEIYPEVVEHGGEKTTDNWGEEITEESTSVKDSSKISSDGVVSSIKETLQETQDMLEEKEPKDETNACQILLMEKPEEQSTAASSKLPSEDGEHGVTTQVHVVEEKELKEVETLDKDCPDTKTRGEICLEEGENKLKAVVEQETTAVQPPTTEIKEEPDFHFEDGSKEDKLKDESPEEIPEQTREIEEASNVNKETHEKAFDNELLPETEDTAIEETPVKAIDKTGGEENQCEKTDEGNEIILNEVSEEVMKNKLVTETFYSTSHSEELIKDDFGEYQIMDQPTEGKTYEEVVVEAQKASENEIIQKQVENKTVGDPGQASVARVETITITEENIELALASFEEKPKPDSEPVTEDQTKETFPEHSKRQDDETGTDVQNQETEEQIRKELKNEPKDNENINREENVNEVTKAVILPEEDVNEVTEVDKEVEKADGSEDIKEHVMEEESSTNELHPASKGEQTTIEVEDNNSFSTDRYNEAESEKHIALENSEVEEHSTNDREGSHASKELQETGHDEDSGDPLSAQGEDREAEEKIEIIYDSKLCHDEYHIEAATEEKLEGQLQTSACTLLSEDEEIRTAHPIEKIEEQIEIDDEIKHESLEDYSETKTVEEACLPNEEQSALEAVSAEESISEQGLSNNEPEVKIQTTSSEEQIQSTPSTLPSEEREHATGAMREEIEHGKTKEVLKKLDVVTGDEITGEQTLEGNKPEEGTTSSPLVSKEKEEENISIVEKTEEKINEADIPDKISEDSSDATKAAETCLEKEEFQELDDAKKDETAAAQALQVEESNEQPLTLELPAENIEHGPTASKEEEEKVKEVQMLEKEMYSEKEGPQEPEAVLHQETIVAQALITEKSPEIETIVTVERLDKEKRKEAEKLEDENRKDSSAGETEEPNELHSVPKEEITSGQTSSEEQLHISTPVVSGEELEHETKETEDEKTNEGEITKDEIEDASDARKTAEICLQKERSIKLEAIVEDEKTADQTHTEKKSEEQVQNRTIVLPLKEEECGSTSSDEKIESRKTEGAEFLQDDNGEDAPLQEKQLLEDEALAVVDIDKVSSQTIPSEKPEEQIPNRVVTLPSEEHKHKTINEVDKTEEEKVKEEEMKKEYSDGGNTVEEISSEKDDKREPQAVLEGGTNTSQVIAEEIQKHGTVTEEKKIKEAETSEDEKSQQSECASKIQGGLEEGATAAHTLTGEMPADFLRITTSTSPSEVQGEEKKETELQEEESSEKIPEQTRESTKASNFNTETHEKAFDNELLAETEDAAIKEKLVKARDATGGEENNCEKTNEGNEIILNEASKEKFMEKEVTETTYATSQSEEVTIDGSREDLKDQMLEGKTYEEFILEAEKTSTTEIIEKQKDPGQASVARIETTTITEENVELALAGFEEKPKCDSEPVAKKQSKETFPEPSKSQDDKISTGVQNQETEEQMKEEQEDKLEKKDYINREENVNEVTKAVILSEGVDNEVEKADGSEDIKKHVMEEESCTNDLHPVSKGDETINEITLVEDYSLLSTECLKKADSKEQIEAKNSEVEEHSTNDRKASDVIKEIDGRRRDEESGDLVSLHGEDREAEEKTKEIIDDSKLCQEESHIEAVTEVRLETSLNKTDISSVKASLQNIESDANQETEVENVQLEEISSELALHIQTNDNDEVQIQNLNMDAVDKDEAEVIKRDPDAFYMPKDQIAKAEKGLTVEKVDQLNSDQELVETTSEATKNSNADELGKMELASDGDCVSEDKGTEQDADTNKSLTAELEAFKVEGTKGVIETSSDHLSQRVETIVKDDISSTNTLPEEKPEEKLQSSACTLLFEDEEMRTAHQIEKTEEEIQKGDKIKRGSLEDSSDSETIKEICLPNEEQKELKAVSEEETAADQGLSNNEPEEQIQITSSTLPSKERKHGPGAITEEIEIDKTKEEIPTKLEVVTGEEITSNQTLEANKPEEGTTGSPFVSKAKEEEVISMVEKTEEEKINKGDIPDKISEDAKKTAETSLEKEEFQELDDAKKDETAAVQALRVEESNEQSLTSELPAENIQHGATVNEEDEEKVKEVEMLEKEMCSEKEGPQELEGVVHRETTVAQASITEESPAIETKVTVEKLDEEKRKEEEKLEDENCEDSSAGETEEMCLQKEEPNELHSAPKEETTSGQTFSEEQLHISTSAVTSEELHETKETEDEKPNEGEIIQDEIEEDASDANTTVEICSQKERSTKLEAVAEDEMTAGQTLMEGKNQNPTTAPPSKGEEGGSTSTAEKIESKKTEEAEFLRDDKEEDATLQKELLQEDEALAVDDDASSQTIPTEKPEEQIPNPVVTLPSEEHKHETVNRVDKTEEENIKEKEMKNGDSDEGNTEEEISTEKEETREPEAVLEGKTNNSQVIVEESQEHGTPGEEKKIKEAENLEGEKSSQLECARELQRALEDGVTAGHTLLSEKPTDPLHSTTSTLPSEVQGDNKETELEEDEGPEKTPEQTEEMEEALNFNVGTCERAFNNELLAETEDAAIKENLVNARDESGGGENQIDKTNKGNEIILDEVSKEVVIDDKEVIDSSYSTYHSVKLTKDGSREDELKDKLIENKTYEELIVEAQKISENEIIEKQIEDKTVEDPGQASVARIETTTVTVKESSIQLSAAGGNQIIDDIQQPKETTNIACDEQIPKESDPMENTGITSSVAKEHVPIELQDRVAESSKKAEVRHVKEIYPKLVEHGGEKTADDSGEEITESTSMEDSTKKSPSEHVESFTKETLQVTRDMIEIEAKDETKPSQILLVEKLQEQSPAPSSKLPSEEGKRGVTAQAVAVEEKELKEVETPDKDSSDTRRGGEICLEKEENKELKAVVEQETIVVQAPQAEIEYPIPHFEDVSKEDELIVEHTGDRTTETLKIPTYEIQNEKPFLETVKDNENNKIIAEDETMKDLEEAPTDMNEAETVRDEIPGEEDPIECRKETDSRGKEQFPTEQQDKASETSDKAEVGDLEPGNDLETCSKAGVDHGKEKKIDNSGVEITQEPESTDSTKLTLSDLLQRSTREKIQVTKNVIEERELIVSKEEPPAEEAKTDEEEGDEHGKTESGSDAPVMVEAPRDTDSKPHKKSHNILSGVGSKVKHSISKVKKVITGKSSHSKESKPISPKEGKK